MGIEILTIPCLQDNFCFLIHNDESGETTLIDASEAAPIQAVLDAKRWVLTDVLLTHHHWDHIDELPALRKRYAPRVVGAAADAHRLPALDLTVADGDTFTTCGQEAQVIDVSGHTIGHIAFYMPGLKAAFTADSLMALGCGRLTEGTPEMMWPSLLKLRALPEDTAIYSAHEYSKSNAAFAITLEPENDALISRIDADAANRAADKPTVPNPLSLEKATNPFLRADDPAFRAAVGMEDHSPLEVFAAIRARKDRF
ncbi:hydroxyacylglutathione hydrolase [Cognatishimia sp. MH4019]|uniref:hydroxyacylglutathione hydrolase n=1 Tax=Cognatishimia sp. MH4019 TaxID=2854030 RepID=UPI001CD76AA4|nr:hydroxyacylglutathione hydrolase [Cognatishimia sp. MH4019]